MRLVAPAKINLCLRVGHPRADGFHPLVSWICTIGLFDNLIVEQSPGGGTTLSCDLPGLACDESNLIIKAATKLADALAKREGAAARRPFGVSVKLEKRIPVGAGLGGGSSDGACVLKGLNRLWAAGWSREDLALLASSLGSDLPFFFHGPSAICRGRGEVVEASLPPRPRFALLILPGIHMPTPAVYRQFDQMGLGSDISPQAEPDWRQWVSLPAEKLLPLLVNDLEPPALAISRQLGVLRAEAEQTIGRIVRMSGSGSSLFSLFDEREEAEKQQQVVLQRHSVKAVVVEVAPQELDG
jgi:4-diphosphocytidyl-2-C-methyl-D-erythritol kinase